VENFLQKIEGNRRGNGTKRLAKHLIKFQGIHDYHKETDTPILLLCEILDLSRLGCFELPPSIDLRKRDINVILIR